MDPKILLTAKILKYITQPLSSKKVFEKYNDISLFHADAEINTKMASLTMLNETLSAIFKHRMSLVTMKISASV